MGFRNPVTTATDPVAQQEATAAQAAAANAQSSANAAAAAAATAQSTANAAAAAANAITSTQITDGAVTTPKLAAGAVTAATIAAGAITAGKVAAGAIDGLTITGSTVQTAASGKRIVLNSANQNMIQFPSGDAAEQLPGQVYVDVIAGTTSALDTPQLLLRPPKIDPVHDLPGGPVLTIVGRSRDGSNKGTIQVNTPITGPDTAWTPLSFASSGWTFWLAAGDPYAPAYCLTADGDVKLTGITKATGAFAAGASSLVAVLPAGYVPDKQYNAPCALLASSGAWQAAGFLQITTGGNVYVVNTSGVALGAGVGFCLTATFRRAFP